MGSTSTFAVALLEFLTVGIAAHSAVRQHRLLPCSFKSIWSHVSSAVLGADGHLRRRSPGMDLEKRIRTKVYVGQARFGHCIARRKSTRKGCAENLSLGDQQRRWDYANGWSRRRMGLRVLGRWNQTYFLVTRKGDLWRLHDALQGAVPAFCRKQWL